MDIFLAVQEWTTQEQLHVLVNDQQLEYLQNLLNQTDIQDIECWLSTTLDRKITDIKDIESKELGLLIKELKSKIKINTIQLLKLQQTFPMQDIKFYTKMIGRDINGLEELTVYEYNNLLTRQNKFTMRSVDIILEHTEEYEYGYQFSNLCKNNKLYYIKFNELMMLDYDGCTLEEVEKYLHYSMHDYFAIYQTFNGYHVFILSRPFNHKDPITYQYMLDLGNDAYYSLFVKNNGFKIRLSKKINRDEKNVTKFIKYYGNSYLCSPYLFNLLNIYNSFSKKFD